MTTKQAKQQTKNDRNQTKQNKTKLNKTQTKLNKIQTRLNKAQTRIKKVEINIAYDRFSKKRESLKCQKQSWITYKTTVKYKVYLKFPMTSLL